MGCHCHKKSQGMAALAGKIRLEFSALELTQATAG
jgi:hypothetical protein